MTATGSPTGRPARAPRAQAGRAAWGLEDED
jgi:hypothetical protein